MASYRIEWKSSAIKELRKLPQESIVRILAAVEALKDNRFLTAQRSLWAVAPHIAFVKAFTGSCTPWFKNSL